MKIYILLIFAFFSCANQQQQVKNFTITKYKEVGNGYQYSKDLFNYNSIVYKPISNLTYENNKIQSAKVYKSEGIVFYSKNDLSNDIQLMKHYDIAVECAIIKNNDLIVYNNTSFKIIEVKKNIIYAKNGKTLLLINYGNVSD